MLFFYLRDRCLYHGDLWVTNAVMSVGVCMSVLSLLSRLLWHMGERGRNYGVLVVMQSKKNLYFLIKKKRLNKCKKTSFHFLIVIYNLKKWQIF